MPEKSPLDLRGGVLGQKLNVLDGITDTGVSSAMRGIGGS